LLALALTTFWLLLSGMFVPLILGFGLLSVALVVWLSRRMDVIDRESYPFALVPSLFTYWLWLLAEIVKSNIDVAKRVLGRSSAVRPVVADASAKQRSDLGLVIHANSITLTPGTVSLEVGQGTIHVHALHPDILRDLYDGDMDARVPDPDDQP
jgi:multicomponent Na+:H+ antiporter subunit E